MYRNALINVKYEIRGNCVLTTIWNVITARIPMNETSIRSPSDSRLIQKTDQLSITNMISGAMITRKKKPGSRSTSMST